jgi:succinylarginine dihydrolase
MRSPPAVSEYNFDGLVGPTHTYAGLSPGNLASTQHAGELGNPRAAALQGLDKMRFVAALGVEQAVLPPQPRPDLATLRRLGFSGSDARMLERAAHIAPELLRACSSASAMWTANAATVAPSSDTADRRVHVTPANLSAMFHRSLEAPTTTRVLREILSDLHRFVVHDALPAGSQFSDEGAANHTRLVTSEGALHLFGWGRTAFGDATGPRRFPARQTFEASTAVARLHGLALEGTLLWQQAPQGIDAGAFHTDVLAVGHGSLLLLHEHAFAEPERLLLELRRRLGPELRVILARDTELSARDAVAAYPFNSQLVSLPSGKLSIIAPSEARESPSARRYLERVVAEDAGVDGVHWVDVNASMNNGGGPACLRLRVWLSHEERASIRARVFWEPALDVELRAWVERHYRDRLTVEDLADPALLEQGRAALDELCAILRLGSVYDFQQP